MNLPYDLNLAIAYACLLALLCWTAFWFVPLALRAIAAALRVLVHTLRARLRQSGPPGGALAEQAREQPWWGPHSAS